MITHLGNFIEHAQKGGWRGARWWVLKQYHRNKPMSISGTNVFNRNWDLLVVVDGCDPDWIHDVLPEIQFLRGKEIGKITSVGTASFDWHERTFGETANDILRQTAVVSANPFVSNKTPDTLAEIDDVGEWGWDEELGVVPAHKVTNAAVKLGRQSDYSRYIVHYMQPHAPFLSRVDETDRTAVELPYEKTHCWDIWYDVMKGRLSHESLRELYVDNLRYVLTEVSILKENFEADTMIITSDHGNAVGQRGMYGHPGRAKVEWLRRVPWIELTASDSEIINPQVRRETSALFREEQLEALGYA